MPVDPRNHTIGPVGRLLLRIVQILSGDRGYYITSAYRDTPDHHGGLVYNGSNTAAIDIGFNYGSSGYRDHAKYLAAKLHAYSGQTVELIVSDIGGPTSGGYYVKNQRRVGAYAVAAHRNHIHFATSEALAKQILAKLEDGDQTMTYAPAKIKEVQVYMKGVTGLPWPSLGIVADGHGDSYHRGKGYVGNGSYSVYESSRDRTGLSGASSAFDLGKFSVTHKGQQFTLFGFNRWLVGECARGAPDTKDIREVIYTLDGKTVRRWDRLKKRSSGDNSHLSHTHISWFRDSENRNKVDLFRRYFEGEDDMSAKDVWQTDGVVPAPRVDGLGRPKSAEDLRANPHWWAGNYMRAQFELSAAARGEQLVQHEALMAVIEEVKNNPGVDFERLKAVAKEGAQEALTAADIAITWGPKGE